MIHEYLREKLPRAHGNELPPKVNKLWSSGVIMYDTKSSDVINGLQAMSAHHSCATWWPCFSPFSHYSLHLLLSLSSIASYLILLDLLDS